MTTNLIKYFKLFIYLYVFVGFNVASAGSYEDFLEAVKRDDAVKVQQLLGRGFDPNTAYPQGQTGLLIAIREPSPKVASALVASSKIDLNTLNAQDESALMLAALKGQFELAEKMISKGADVNKTGWTPLHYAASGGHVAVVRLLLEHHAYIDAISPNGTTPLMMASMYGSAAAVQALLEEGADPLLTNLQGLTALQFAQRANRPDSAELIIKGIRSQRPAGQW